MTDKELQEYTRANWYRIDQNTREAIVQMLREELNMGSFKEQIEANPVDWSTKGMWHFGQGMQIRNLLREKGFADQDLPGVPYNIAPFGGDEKIEEMHNWDDFYTAAIEAAAGVIEV